MTIKPSELRKNLFSVIDRCIETGETVEVPRKGRAVRIVPTYPRIAIADLPQRPGVLENGDDLDSFSPSEWNPG